MIRQALRINQSTIIRHIKEYELGKLKNESGVDESNKQHEKANIKATPAKPGKLERFDTSYEKNGVSNIFLSFEPLTGKRFVNVAERRTTVDWAKHIQELVEAHHPDAKKSNWLLIL